MVGCLWEGSGLGWWIVLLGAGCRGVEVSTRRMGESELEREVSISSGLEEFVLLNSSQSLSTSPQGEEVPEVKEDTSSDSTEAARPACGLSRPCKILILGPPFLYI